MGKNYYRYQNAGSQPARGVFLILVIFVLGGCAATTKIDEDGNEVVLVDPYENVNRKIYHFNGKVDEYVAAPVSSAYRYITPQFVQTGVANFFGNLKTINTVLNDMMQAKFQQGAEDTGRFLVNSTVGLLGLFDVASEIGLEQHEEDFDQTLSVWGVPSGSYLVLPFIGPSTTRGVPGAIFDTAANPASYVGVPVQLVQMLNTRANAEGALKFVDEAALDPYVFTREAFLQWRHFMAKDGAVELEGDDLMDFEDELMDDADDTQAETAAPGGDTKAVEDEKAKGYKLKLSPELPTPANTDTKAKIAPQVQ
ncbi:MAG: ABC transporter [Gammaproteobacteria bacterium HGW-Gammaproteobacteria-3]|nr:MAG: ABC transporter [Gammaproteobacteria bacterium HGW-Gammaproteobacteria-3]